MFLEVLDLARSGSKEDQIESILAFLLEPQDSGKVCVVQEAMLSWFNILSYNLLSSVFNCSLSRSPNVS